MVRVAGLWDQVDAGIDARGPDGLAAGTDPGDPQPVAELDRRLTRVFERKLKPQLTENGIKVATLADLNGTERAELDRIFDQQVFPALTLLVIGLGRPFPYISNLP